MSSLIKKIFKEEGIDGVKKALGYVQDNINPNEMGISELAPEALDEALNYKSQLQDFISKFDSTAIPNKKAVAGVVGTGALLSSQESEASPMSRFSTLLNGLEQAAPQIKGTLESWAREMKTLDPVKDKRRMEELSSNIRSTVEANAQRNVPAKAAVDPAVQRDMNRLNAYDQMTKTKAGDILKEGPQTLSSDQMKKAAAGFVADSPFAPGKADPLTALNQATENTGRNLVNKYMADSSPENKALAQKTFEVVANPANLAGGLGLADLAMGAAEIAPELYEAGKARFKGLFGK